MILVDTNVWSELTRAIPDPAVLVWEAANADRLWLATVVIGELLSGAHLLPEGKRKQAFLANYDELIAAHADRIVPFDLAASLHYGPVLAAQERAGQAPGTADTQIAAIALAYGMLLATRNTKHFEGLGLALIDPWTD
ncbi:type II toxin-antitoxin system VapC family toxin [Polymorphobacter megasporae]|uniref:type II toxin-antitoxin system VapC family toxin n=1 Tax=Glacieibacterium megasporae TaxID=2835787 RepID=UPI001C1E0588|nr:type II toxin-antitoxin system VapC family toxin [Polymorphobacter megasporae]UAJ09425.1 type II toxin-antitoxin system VapC family toxin [Polymorphobacter megasporae]